MTKEIIVNAAEMESRVAILENGRLMELHIEREQKIVGNIYKGRVTKVLKGMDAAFVDIGIELNGFLSASDVVAQEDDEEGGSGHGRGPIPPITQLLHANQEILVQVVRAPMGTKGARITTRLSLPGRYMVLMLNSGTYVGVSRKIEDSKERQRLRAIAGKMRPENYSLIVRTEADGKSEEELQQDLVFLLDMAGRIEEKAAHVSAPALVHGDMTLVLRLIRDAFTRDINRLVVDSPSAYENILELVGMLSPHLKNRVFLYEEELPIFHAYNIEPEIERTLRRKVWLPSGGSLIIDQAEALIAIDVNTGRFVGSVELAETVLTTNLQAAEEVARQLRLRDLGGIIVVDFIDMDNPRHRSLVMKAFEEALRRDRAKIKVHNISALGLVEMTRKRTGESLSGLLTEPCPYCSGIGRVQNALTMALRIQRELATTAVEHPRTEAFLVIAHPRVVACMLGYEDEVHHDLEQYLGRPVYLRSEEHYHPNTYRMEHLTLEQALLAVSHVEDGDIVEGRVMNPDPEVSLAPLVDVDGIFVVVPNLDAPVGSRVKVRITITATSMATAEPMAAEQRGIRTEKQIPPLAPPPLLSPSVLPLYLSDERANVPPRGLPLLAPAAEAVPEPVEEAEALPAQLVESTFERRRNRHGRHRRGEPDYPAETREAPLSPPAPVPMPVEEPVIAEMPPAVVGEVESAIEAQPLVSEGRRRRRRRKNRSSALQHQAQGEISGEQVLDTPPTEQLAEDEEMLTASESLVIESPLTVSPSQFTPAAEESEAAEPGAEMAQPERNARRRRRSRSRRRSGEREVPYDVLEETKATDEAVMSEKAAFAEETVVAEEAAFAEETVELEEAALAEEAVVAEETVELEEIALAEAVADLFAEPTPQEPEPETTGMQELLALQEPKREEVISHEDLVSMISSLQSAPELPVVITPEEAEITAAGVETESPAAEAMPEEAAPVPEAAPPAPKPARKRTRSRKIAALAEESVPAELFPEAPPPAEAVEPRLGPPEETPVAEAEASAATEEVPAYEDTSPTPRRRRPPRRRTRASEEPAETPPVEEHGPPVELTEG